MTLESDHIDAQQEAMRPRARESGGARITQETQDPMFRKLMMWCWGIFGTAFMAMQVWLVSNVADIKTAMQVDAEKRSQMNTHIEYTDKRVDRLEDRADYMRDKVNQIEGKTLRGIEKEARR